MVELGVQGGWSFVDIYGLDSDLLLCVPKPVISVLLLYPLDEVYDLTPLGVLDNDSGVIFIRQTISNACGSVAILHALVNNYDMLTVTGIFLSII